MRNPRRSRDIWFVVMLVGAASLGGAIAMGDIKKPPPAQLVMAALGLTGFFFGAALGLSAFVETRRYDRFMRGDDEIGRWSVSPAGWRAFYHFNVWLNQNVRYTAMSHITGAEDRREGNVEVVFSREAFMVDGDFHSLPKGGVAMISPPTWIALPADVPGIERDEERRALAGILEFQCKVYNKSGVTRWSLRIPVPPGAEEAARKVHAHYVERFPPPKPRSPRFLRNMRNIALVLMLLCAVGAGIAVWVMQDPQLKKEWTVQLMVTLIVGVMAGPASAIIALVAHVQYRRRVAKTALKAVLRIT